MTTVMTAVMTAIMSKIAMSAKPADLPDLIYLASQSPRRRELLTEMGLEFQVILPDDDAEDEQQPNESVDNYVRRLATQKAQSAAKKIERGTIIACDTVVCCQDEVLEKPLDKNDAKRMLELLRGKKHCVVSGLCVLTKSDHGIAQQKIAAAQTELFMQNISDNEIEQYLETNNWIGKAGAFGYQDNNSWIKIIKGSESNVVGLPTELLKELLL
jgi:septum formation protein